MKVVLKYFLVSLSLIIAYSISGMIFKGNHLWMIFSTLLFAFWFSYFIHLKSDPSEYLALTLFSLIPILFIFTITSYYGDFSRSLTYLIFLPVSYWLGYVFAKKRRIYIPVLSVIIFLFSAFIFMPNLFVLYHNYGARTDKEFSELTLVNSEKDTVRLDSSKIIVLDFWTTSCGYCFKMFPDYEKYYLVFKDDPNFELYSVNVPLKRDTFEKTAALVKELNYKFPTLYATSELEVEELGIDAYPHLLILKSGKIRYDGRLETDKFIFINHIKGEISKLLKE